MFVTCLFVLFTTDFSLAAGTFTWTAPPPAWTPTDGNDIRTVNFPVLNGSTNVALRWNYVLGGGETLALATWIFNGNQVALLTTVPSVSIKDDRFAVNTSEVATLIIKNVSDITDGTIRCVAHTDVNPWKYDIQVEITVPPKITSTGDSQNITEGSELVLFCNATGKPAPNITWTRVLEGGTDGQELFVGNPWIILNISRSATGTYRCTADNGIGSPVNHTISANILYKPDKVTLETNTSENTGCSDLWVNFTCISSKANPPVYKYLLFENTTEMNSSQSGSWIKKISKGGKHTYSCMAYQSVKNVQSKDITLTLNVPISVREAKMIPLLEGSDVEEDCLDVAGFPYPTIDWRTRKNQFSNESTLRIPNINRGQAGEYRCFANNKCGNASTVLDIDVQFKPENVRLSSNTTSKEVCAGVVINLTCTADANPSVHTYSLYENNTATRNMGNTSSWVRKLVTTGKSVFRCRANNSIQEATESDDAVYIVNVPPSVKQVKNESVERGGSIKVYCNATGFPTPTFMWTKDNTDVSNESVLIFKNISTDEAGEYRCTARNTCGNASLMVYIDVIYKPENVVLRSNSSSNEVCAGVSVNLICTAEANPPVHSYVLYKNDVVIEGLDNGGTWIERLDTVGNFTYRCEVINSVPGIEESRNLTFTVNDPPSVKQVKNESVEEGDSVRVYCNATGFPTPTFLWTKNNTDISNESVLIFKNISTDEAGEYRCSANNTCGNASIMVYIDVQYSPSITNITGNLKKNEGEVAKLDCEAHGNPTPSYTWENVSFKTVGRASSTTVHISGKESEGYYTCIANNGIGTSASEKVYIFVEYHSPVKTVLTTDAINKTVKINETFRLNCSAEANPPAMYKIYNDTDILVGNDSITTIVVKEPIERVTFRCDPNNTYGVGPTTKITLKVLFPPYVDTNVTVVKYEGSSASLPCPARGNPPPSFEWYKGDISNPFQSSTSSLDFPSVTLDADGLYTCQATNPLGTAEATVNLIVKRIEKTIPIRCVIEEERNESEMNDTCELCSALACNLSDHCVGKETTSCKRGSIIVDFLLKFNQNVDTNKVLSDLEKAVVEKRFWGLAVDPKCIRQISSSSSTSTTESATTEGTFTKGPECEETTFKERNCETKWVMIIVIITVPVGGSGVVIIIIYHVHKKRKCRKKTRVDNSDGQPLSSNHSTLSCGNPFAEVNSGYAKSGPLPAVDNKQGQGAGGGEAIPTYAVVDKSEKKDKKKKKKAAEHESTEDQYAVVDKSKKKKKRNEQDNTYAEVDTSKKSKKKQKPGEVLYADLDEFHQMQKMPEVPTSPERLPPIKMPEAYGETQYADITQFLKGNYEDTGTGLPKDITTPAASNTATESKEESSAGNTGDGSKASNETGF